MANRPIENENDPVDIVSVAEGKRIFEQLVKKDSVNSDVKSDKLVQLKPVLKQTQSAPVQKGRTNEKHYSSVRTTATTTMKQNAPPKPKRTFAEDHYFDPNTLAPVTTVKSKKVTFTNEIPTADNSESSHPIKPIVPIRRLKTVKETAVEFPTDDHEQNKQEKPKYFQLSHDYEQLFSNKFKSHLPRGNFASVQNLSTITERDNEPENRDYRIYEVIDDDIDDGPLYYSSTDIIDLGKRDASANLKKLYVPEDPVHIVMKKPSKTNIGDSFSNQTYELCDESDVENRVLRAIQIRRQSLMHYDHQEESFLKRKDPKLFEFAALMELKPNDKSDRRFEKQFMPTVSCVYPEHVYDTTGLILQTLKCLCYPDINIKDFDQQVKTEEEHFIITLTDCCGDRKFAYCNKWYANKRKISSAEPTSYLPFVLCIVSPVQAIDFYQGFVNESETRAKVCKESLIIFLRRYYNQPLPALNEYLIVKSIRSNINTVLFNKKASKGTNYLHLVLERFGVDDMITLFYNLLTEKRILLIGDNVSVLSKIIQGATNMLAPFLWPHPSIPTVPDFLLEFVDSPSPYVMGILRPLLPAIGHLFKKEYDFVFICDIDHGILKNGTSMSRKDDASDEDSCRFMKMNPVKNLRAQLFDITRCSPKLTPDQTDCKSGNVFLQFFADVLNKYKDFTVNNENNGFTKFHKESFIKSASTKYERTFLKYFVETGMFQIWMNDLLQNRGLKSSAANVQLDRAIAKLQTGAGSNRNMLNKLVKKK